MEQLESEFFNLITHTTGSIRQALQTLTVSLDLLSDRLDLFDGDVSRQAASAIRSVFQLQRTATYLDLFRQFSCGGYALRLQHCDLGEYVNSLTEKAADMLAAGGIRLEADLPAQPIVGNADRALIELLVLELLGNAAACASDKTIRLTLRRPKSRLLVFTVENHSDRELPDQLFARYSAEPTEASASAGLGLQVVSLGARCHGGSLVLSCGPDRTVRAVMSVRMPETASADSLKLSVSPIESVDRGRLVLSTVLPWQVYDLKDLQ